MPELKQVSLEHVLSAIHEHDAEGDHGHEPADEPVADGPREASVVGNDVARSAWADSARDVLLETARRYQHVLTYKELGGEVQTRTNIRTKQLTHYWIGDVLGRVSADCASRDEPLLSSLCVNNLGSVGEGYAAAVVASGRPTPEDPDEHAAAERLACHRHFGADLPEGGGRPALVPKLAAARTRARKERRAERPVAQCPVCHLQLPATLVCDNCA